MSLLPQKEPVLHPGVRHQVEARERGELTGTTSILHEFSRDGYLNLPAPVEGVAQLVKPPREDVATLDAELDAFVEAAIDQYKARRTVAGAC